MATQVAAIKMVVPRSGSNINSTAVRPREPTTGKKKWRNLPRYSSLRDRAAARKTMTANFENSEAWTVTLPTSIQRRDPPRTVPIASVAIRPAIDTAKMSPEKRLYSR